MGQSSEHLWVLYSQASSFGLQQAAESLEQSGFRTTRTTDKVTATSGGFTFELTMDPGVAELRAFASKDGGPGHRRGLSKCDAVIEVEFVDLAKVLQEINTLIELEAAVQQGSGGYLYLGWNRNVQPQPKAQAKALPDAATAKAKKSRATTGRPKKR